MDPELQTFLAQIKTAKSCEDVFGVLTGDRPSQHLQAKTLYRKFASVVHEDKHAKNPADLEAAHEAMSLLSTFWSEAKRKIEKGTYGTPEAVKYSAVVAGPKHKYEIHEALGAGDLANLYAGVDETAHPVLVKMSRHAAVNDLLAVESRVLADLLAGVAGHSYQRFFPHVVDAFKVKDHLKIVRHVTVFADSRDGHVFTLNDLVANFPKGIDPRHFVWIFKRLLTVLGYAHGRGWVHGAVLPTHILVRSADHSILLVDWSYACKAGERVVAISPGYKGWYAPEVLSKQKAGSATDLFMAAKCMEHILGGEAAWMPSAIPTPFLAVLRGCLLPNPNRRSASTETVYDALDRAAQAVYGPPKFVDLVLT